jgi:RNA polymerase sigma-70 factor, ECF subfamily
VPSLEAQNVPLKEPQERSKDLIAIDDALKALETWDARKARVVEMRFFGGLTAEETAEVLKVSPDTVLRDWSLARAWLYGELNKGHNNDA